MLGIYLDCGNPTMAEASLTLATEVSRDTMCICNVRDSTGTPVSLPLCSTLHLSDGDNMVIHRWDPQWFL